MNAPLGHLSDEDLRALAAAARNVITHDTPALRRAKAGFEEAYRRAEGVSAGRLDPLTA
jgi:hypothetical protein